MIPRKFIIILFLTGLCSCKQEQDIEKHKADPAAIELNNKAMTLVTFMNIDSTRKAIILLDSATAIDSNYFLGYFNKMIFLNELKQYDRSIQTIHSLIRIKPGAHDLYMTGGIMYEKVGDNASSKTYFQKSLTICNNVLDTMNVHNIDYSMVTTNKAINLIMLDDTISANRVLKSLYNNLPDDPDFGNVEKKYILSLMNKTKKELLDFFANPNKEQ